MSQELAARSAPDSRYGKVLESFRLVLETVAPEDFLEPDVLCALLDGLKAGFDRDSGRLQKAASLLFGEDISSYGREATALFTQWEREGGGPALTAMVALAVERLGLDLAHPLVRCALAGAVLAEYPNALPYHGNEHYRKVLFHGIRMIATHNFLFGGTNRMLQEDHIAKLLAAACIHDLGHVGGDNLKEGVYTPGFMEQRAFDIARPYFEALGMGPDDMKDIETIVFCTDITFFAGDNSPCIRMKKIYKHFFWDDRNEDVSMMMMGKLRRFEDNPRLVLMAMILHESDVATSAGLSYEQTVRETLSIMGERGVPVAGPRTVLAFLREQLGETLFTEAGKQIFGRVMTEVIARAEKDLAEGRETFSPDRAQG